MASLALITVRNPDCAAARRHSCARHSAAAFLHAMDAPTQQQIV